MRVGHVERQDAAWSDDDADALGLADGVADLMRAQSPRVQPLGGVIDVGDVAPEGDGRAIDRLAGDGGDDTLALVIRGS